MDRGGLDAMPPTIALVVWLVLLLVLFHFDPAKDPETSLALWVPVIWIFFLSTRLPSQWWGGSVGMAAQVLEDGNSIDRSIDLLLIVLAIATLTSRTFNWGQFFARNIALIAFLSFALLSVVWSDFHFVAFKRWIRDLGNYLVILVALSDPHPLEAVRTLLRRVSYLIIPLSVLLIKYFPALGKQFGFWSGAAQFVGATTSKNMLGVVCLISGVFFFWDTVARWANRKEKNTKRIIYVNFVFIGMTLWLLNLSNSATSKVCLAIGCLIIVMVHSNWGQRHPVFLKVLVPSIFVTYLVLAYGFGINGSLASQIGRDPTLTDRTALWKMVLGMHTNPLLGTGYESFWLGPRLKYIWFAFGAVNESHNGYLEIYLNLGIIGVALLVWLLLSSYRKISKKLSPFSNLASLNLALWTITLFYNMTEAAFKGQLVWLAFLLAAIAIPQRTVEIAPESAPIPRGNRMLRNFKGASNQQSGSGNPPSGKKLKPVRGTSARFSHSSIYR